VEPTTRPCPLRPLHVLPERRPCYVEQLVESLRRPTASRVNNNRARGVGVAQGDAVAPKWVETFRVQYSAPPAVGYTAVTSRGAVARSCGSRQDACLAHALGSMALA
jgi:hypothetical protein